MLSGHSPKIPLMTVRLASNALCYVVKGPIIPFSYVRVAANILSYIERVPKTQSCPQDYRQIVSIMYSRHHNPNLVGEIGLK